MESKKNEFDRCMLEAERLLRRRIESAKARFGRRMKSPKRVTENKEGSPYGDIRYSDQEKFRPAGGGEK